MEEALVADLRADTPLANLVGDHVDWGQRPPGDELPGVVLRVISPGRSYDHEGADQLSNPRVRADCWGRTYEEVKLISRALEAAMTPPRTRGGIEFTRAFLAGSIDFGPEDIPGGEKAFRVTLDFFVWWRATT